MDEHLKSIIECEKELFQTRYEKWLTYDIFSIRWWILIGALTNPWFVWYWLIDKKRLQEMLLYTFATSFIAILLDEMGIHLTLWAYPINITPLFSGLISANYIFVPIIFTLIYQYIPKWKSFIIANLIIALIFSLILEPLLVWGKLYVLISWKYIYSIPVYFFTSVFLKCFSEYVKSVQSKYQ